MSTYEQDWPADPDPYWEADCRNDRDEWDAHVRAVDEDERDRLQRDVGESGSKGKAA